MENFYRIPYERFEKYAPYGDAAEVADFLAGYVEQGCKVFNIMPVAENDAAGIDAGEIQQALYAGGLAGAVHTYEAKKLPLSHLEIHAVENLEARVAFGDLGNPDGDWRGDCMADLGGR